MSSSIGRIFVKTAKKETRPPEKEGLFSLDGNFEEQSGFVFVVQNLDIVQFEIVKILYFRIQPDFRRFMRRSGELFLQFLFVSVIDMRDVHVKDVFPQLVTGNLCDHALQNIVLGDVERQTYLLFP